jgi:menaquinone-dependent protoporphyrinogen oxidase
MARILVLYGTADGHTAKIAGALAAAIRGDGTEEDVVDAAQADPSPGAYSGVVIASPIHAGRYERAVERWVRAHAAALRGVRSALVSVCLGVLQHDPGVDRDLRSIADRFLAATSWQPDMTKVVAGALLYTRYNWLKRWLMRRIAGKAGGDVDTSRDYEYTDWEDLRRFAGEFAAHLHG